MKIEHVEPIAPPPPPPREVVLTLTEHEFAELRWALEDLCGLATDDTYLAPIVYRLVNAS